MDIGPHEVLGIFLKHVVDLVEQVVGLRGKLLAALLTGTCIAGGTVVIAAATATFKDSTDSPWGMLTW